MKGAMDLAMVREEALAVRMAVREMEPEERVQEAAVKVLYAAVMGMAEVQGTGDKAAAVRACYTAVMGIVVARGEGMGREAGIQLSSCSRALSWRSWPGSTGCRRRGLDMCSHTASCSHS